MFKICTVLLKDFRPSFKHMLDEIEFIERAIKENFQRFQFEKRNHHTRKDCNFRDSELQEKINYKVYSLN